MFESSPKIGSPAPDFSLPGWGPRGECDIRLKDLRGNSVALVFYPKDFSLVCPTELSSISQRIEDFRRFGCVPLAISADSVETHHQWVNTPIDRGGVGELQFELLSDTKGKVAKRYNVFDKVRSIPRRALFIIDPHGKLQYMSVQCDRVGRGIDEVLRLLAALQSEGICSVNWQQGNPLLDVEQILSTGRILSNYRIEDNLGTGSYGAVYRATDLILGRTVALKILRPQGFSHSGMVLAEARAVAAINHPNVCAIHCVDDTAGVPMIVMEHVDGQPLTERIPAGGFEPQIVASFLQQIAEGLAHAHENGILHRDLKPCNIMVADDGKIKIVDFGIAIRADQEQIDLSHTIEFRDQKICGTPRYMSPEQVAGETLTPRSDIFALGLITYLMLTGDSLVSGETCDEVFDSIKSIEPVEMSDRFDEPWTSLLMGMLAKSPKERISLEEVIQQIDRITSTEAPSAKPIFAPIENHARGPILDDGWSAWQNI